MGIPHVVAVGVHVQDLVQVSGVAWLAGGVAGWWRVGELPALRFRGCLLLCFCLLLWWCACHVAYLLHAG